MSKYKNEDFKFDIVNLDNGGGQHTNGPQRIGIHCTHTPTGITAYVQGFRSGHKAREAALMVVELALDCLAEGW